jgi:FAD synthase
VDGLTYAIRAVVVHQRRQDATVGFAITGVFLESDVAAASVVVGNKEYKVLTYLSVYNVGIFV